jgi:hypothetical protein
MIYTLTIILFLIGVLFHAMVKVTGYKKQFEKLTFLTIWRVFFNEEWDSLLVSILVLSVTELSIFIINYTDMVIPDWLNWGIYPIALVLGYQGQRIAYKFLNTATDVLEKKAESVSLPTPKL